MDNKLTISIKEAAELLGVGTPAVKKLIDDGDFPAFKIGRRYFIFKDGVEQWVADKAAAGVKKTKKKSEAKG